MIQYMTDKGVISVGTVFGSQMLPSGYLVSGVQDFGTLMQDLEPLFPITFPKSGITWTVITAQETGRTRYRIDDSQGSFFRAYTNYSLFSYPSVTNPTFACAGIRDGDSVTMNKAYADDITTMINRISADVYVPDPEKKSQYCYVFPDGFKFYLGQHEKVTQAGVYPLSALERRSGKREVWYDGLYERGTTFGELFRHFYNNGITKSNALYTSDNLTRYYYALSVSGSAISLYYETRATVTSDWSSRKYFWYYTALANINDPTHVVNHTWYSLIPKDLSTFTSYQDWTQLEEYQMWEFTEYENVGIAVYNGHNITPTSHYTIEFVSVSELIDGWSRLNVEVPKVPDEPGSDSGGGDGTFDFDGDDITLPPVPPIDAIGTGFVTIYRPTREQLTSLSSYLWSDLFSLDSLKKLFANPMDLIIGLSLIPVSPPISGTTELKVAGFGTGIMCDKVSSQFMTVSCGQIEIPKRYATFLDYSPYTKCEIFLPFIGSKPLNPNEIMGKRVEVVYRVDILTGACNAFILANNSVIAQFSGSMIYQIPVTATDYKSTVNGILSIATTAVGVVAGAVSGGAGTGVAIAAMNAGNVVNSVENIAPDIAVHGGSNAGASGILSSQTPYLVWTYPRESRPKYNGDSFKSYVGDTSNIAGVVSDFNGFLVCSEVHIEPNAQIEKEEIFEIEKLLKSGVFV